MNQSIADLQTMLTNVNDAINARLTGGQVNNYIIDGTQVGLIPLSELYTLRNRLQAEISSGQDGGGVTYARFRRPK